MWMKCLVLFFAMGGSMKTPDKLVTLLDLVRADFPYQSLQIANDHLQTQLKETASNSTFFTYEGPSQDPLIKSLELRGRFDQKNAPQLVVIQLRKPLPADLALLEKSLGVQGQDMGATTPHLNEPTTYMRFKLNTAELRLTFDLQKRVTQMIFDGFAR